MNRDIIVCGDTHAYWGPLNQLINRRKPKLILQVGDFGWWPRLHDRTEINIYGKRKRWNQYGIKNPETEILWCPGNHEDWEELDLRGEFSEVMPRVYYMPRGSTYTLDDDRVVLFVGGGLSIDKHLRTMGIDWFPQEMVPASILYKMEEKNLRKVDIVISHTCPFEFNSGLNSKMPYIGWEHKFHDSSQEVLSEVLNTYKPVLWYFGHFHVRAEGHYKLTNTRWFALSDIPNAGWWRYLS